MKVKRKPLLASSRIALLRAAEELTRSGNFSAEDLVVSAWKKDNHAFGLKGFSDQYPDSNKVYTALMGVNGLVQRGWLKKEGPKLYSATEQTRKFVAALPPPPSDNPTAEEKQFFHYWGTDARNKFDQGIKDSVTFAEALQFWVIGTTDKEEVVRAQLAKPEQTADALDTLFQGRKNVTLSNGMVVSTDDVKKLRAMHTTMHTRFWRHLNMLIDRNK